ncbi:MAG: LPS export ABC transporter periplasmic protein LptC [Bdellovibrionales bacterium]|jgi:lipopolysaccharide export system protein LptC
MNESQEDSGSRSRLDFIRPRLTKRIQIAREGRMAPLIRRLRIWLPALAVTVIAVLFLWPYLLPNFRLYDIAKNIPDLAIDNLRLTGVDSKNQPYSLLAAQATKPSTLNGIYDLTKPEGEITMQSGEWIDGKADFGRYDEIGKKLWLGGNVRIFHDKGYQATTDEAQINLNNSDAYGDKNVLIQGSFGTIQGVGFRFLDSGHTVIIKGPAKAVLSTKP